MKDLKAKDLQSKSVEELEKMVADARAALYKHRRELAMRKSSDTSSTITQRHNIARMLTVITQKGGKA
jgi:large subunit ribosomal protein L29